jgi:hypothetical protein
VYAGHVAWITPVVFVGVFAVRYLTSPRRRQGGRGPVPPGSAFMGRPQSARSHAPDRRDQGAPRAAATAGGSGHTGTAPGWFRDPFVRHEERYWSGTAWTEHVTDHGAPAIDPPPATSGGGRGDQ